jgi:ABC-type nitrate/sulfonate/bicarbonate transport system substrate-binding protein
MIRRTALALFFALLAAGLSMTGAHAADKPTVRLAILSDDLTSFCLPLRIAVQGDHPLYAFSKDDIDLKTIHLSVSQTPVAVGTGDVDMGDCAGISVVTQAWKKGARDVVILAAGAVKPAYVIIAGPKFKKIQDLKGATIASPGPQSTAAEAVDLILKRGANMRAGKDYTFVSAGTGAARVAALSAGRVAAISTYAPYNYELTDRGFNQLADEMTYVPQYVSGCVIGNRKWAAAHADVVVRMLKTVIQIAQWLMDPANKNAAFDWFAEHYRIGHGKLGKAYAARFYHDTVGEQRIAFNGYADEAAIRANLDIMHERGYLKTEDYPPLDKMVDYTYLNRALKELGMPAVKTFAGN